MKPTEIEKTLAEKLVALWPEEWVSLDQPEVKSRLEKISKSETSDFSSKEIELLESLNMRSDALVSLIRLIFVLSNESRIKSASHSEDLIRQAEKAARDEKEKARQFAAQKEIEKRKREAKALRKDNERRAVEEQARQKLLQEEKAAQLEKERIEAQQRDVRYKKFLHQIELQYYEFMMKDFLSSRIRISEWLLNSRSEFVVEEDYLNELMSGYIIQWFQNVGISNPKIEVPDTEQAIALGATETHILTTARAGSGKTRTLVNRVFFLIEHCKIRPNEILVLAFNRSAAREIKKRLLFCMAPQAKELMAKKNKEYRPKSKYKSFSDFESDMIFDVANELGLDLPYVMTFHALAYAIVLPNDLIVYDPPEGQKLQSEVVNKVVEKAWADPDRHNEIKQLFFTHFRNDLDMLERYQLHKGSSEVLEWVRQIPKETLAGEQVKSLGEKWIADFFFEHGIEYQYEQLWSWGQLPYRPDFTIPLTDKTLILEYFGLKGVSPIYDSEIRQKQDFWEKKKTSKLISIFPEDAHTKEQLWRILSDSLKAENVKFHKLTDDLIWEKVNLRFKTKYAEVVAAFINRAKNNKKSWTDIQKESLSFNFLSESETIFTRQAINLYFHYEKELNLQNKTDFANLLTVAENRIRSSSTVFTRKSESGDLTQLKYLLIDEFQDFNLLFQDMTKAIRSINPEMKVFCVGDDWQAINGFAGSDTTYFRQFSLDSETANYRLSNNYRSAALIVDYGNELMAGQGFPARTTRNGGLVARMRLDNLTKSPSELQTHERDQITPAVLRLINTILREKVSEGSSNLEKEIVILSRTNSVPGYNNKFESKVGESQLKNFERYIRSFFSPEISRKIKSSTVHSYKGRESDTVILVDCDPGRYPLIHSYWIFSRILGNSLERIFEEERRLFYVAVTRAANKLYLLSSSESFIEFFSNRELSERISIFPKWESFHEPQLPTQPVIIHVSNSNPKYLATIKVKEKLLEDGYKWGGATNPVWWKTIAREDFDANNFSIRDLTWAKNVDNLNGLTLRIFHQSAGELLILNFIENRVVVILNNLANFGSSSV